MKLSERLKGKKILIWGFGREGKSSLNFITQYCEQVTVDIADGREIVEELPVHQILLVPQGEKPDILAYDYVLKTPGIVIDGLTEAELRRLTSQTELFMEVYRDQIIGVTGTKGKSTTSSLMAHLLQYAKKDAILVGNIGLPCFDFASRITEETIIIFELSCHQLELLTVSPRIGVILNLYPDHLDHYGTFEKYADAKLNILLHQKKGDYSILGSQVIGRLNERQEAKIFSFYGIGEKGEIVSPNLMLTDNLNASLEADDRIVSGLPSTAVSVKDRTMTVLSETNVISAEDTNLPGLHNVYNIAIAYLVCAKLFSVEKNVFYEGLKTFYGLPHRLQKLGNFLGVDYYDDSISTVCETAIQAVNSVPNAKTLLLGGMDRGIDYDDLVKFVLCSKLEQVILLPGTAERLLDLFEGWRLRLLKEKQAVSQVKLYTAKDMQDAVAIAASVTKQGDACILSPAAASYGFYKNFEERGEVYAACVRGLLEEVK